MKHDLDLVWKQLRKSLGESTIIDSATYNEYVNIAKLAYVGNENGYAIVTPTEFSKDVLSTYETYFKTELKRLLNEPITLEFLIQDEFELRERILKNGSAQNNDQYEFSFETFVSGPTNVNALEAAKTISQNLGTRWNPLFIYGATGLGKTHLLKAIENAVHLDSNFKLQVRFIDAESFGNAVVEIIKSGHEAIETFINETYGEYDVLLIDDIQLIAKREKTNEILFRIFNHFITAKKQMVITSDKYPEELNGFEARLISRFQSGLTAGIESPDYETAMAIINSRLASIELATYVSDEVKKYMASNLASDVRKILGFISKLQFWNIQNNPNFEVITLDHIDSLIKDIPTSNIGKLNPRRIKEVVADMFNVDVKAMESKTRVKTFITPRYISMYLMKEMLNMTLDQIGREFSNRDHSSVVAGINKLHDSIIKKEENKKIINKLIKMLSTM